MSEEALPRRIQGLHAWYCEAMGTALPLNMAAERQWFFWLKEGFNGPQLRKVIVYLRKEIRAQRRNPGALKLRNLLDPELFGEDLLLAGHDLSAENRVPKLPDGEGGHAVGTVSGKVGEPVSGSAGARPPGSATALAQPRPIDWNEVRRKL